MSAQAQMRAGQGASAQAEGKAASKANPIVSALHQMAVSVLSEQLREMFEKADDILFDSAEKARASDEQRLYLDTMRIVRVQRNKIVQAFQEALQAALAGIGEDEAENAAGRLDDMSQWSLEDGDVLEERIAVNNMQAKASSLYAHELVELQRRIARLAEMTGAGLSPESMSPQRIIHAFQNSMRDLPVDFPIKLVIYKLFDRVVVGRLSEVFVGANQLLAVHGIEPSLDAPTPARPESRRAPRGLPQDSGVPSWAGKLDRATMGAFGAPATGGAGMSAMGAGAVPGGLAARQAGHLAPVGGAGTYTDSMLAQDVAQILGSYEHGRRPQAPAWLPPENVALVARMFDAYYRDPRLPDNLKPVLARLQLPMLKAAVADPRFFHDPNHAARRTLNDLFEMLLQFGSAEAAPSPQMVGELQGLIDAMVQAFNLDPATLRESARPEGVDERTAEAFLREQEEMQQKKNRARVERVRRIVAHEIRRRIGERPLPSGVLRLMLSGFGPLLCLDYIRSGVNGASWTETMRLVDRVLDSLRPDAGRHAEERAAEEAELVAAISRRLAAIGFSEERLKEVLSGLLQAYLELVEAGAGRTGAPAADTVDEAATAAAPLPPEKELQGLLSILLVPGSWFTLWEPVAQTKHWVRVKGYYPVQNTVMFGHYMEERFLQLRATALATALVDGSAAPIDPSPELQSAIARIGELSFERVVDPVVWTTVEGRPGQ
ncbi:DUF1631 family protein [Fontimonas sp. SYSU GA230001]|uniref:DUF1631 family protein n=1 Tax=Fontimonas sp. SYSU GA230001 TaxID=3142450 RepID=UPI0032B35388